MKKTNVIIKNANLDILKNIPDNLEKVDKQYKGYQAPCVVFEDDNGDVYFVAYTTEEYLENIDRQPPTLAEKQKALSLRVNAVANKALDFLAIKYQVADRLGSLALLRDELRDYKKDTTLDTLEESEKDSYLQEEYPTISIFAKDEDSTFEEEVTKIKEKIQISNTIGARTKSLQKKIFATTTEEGLAELDTYITMLENLKSIAEFMAEIAKE